MTLRVRLTREAQDDLERLFDYVLQRKQVRPGGDLQLVERALGAIRAGVETLKTSPFTCRKAGQSPFLRELLIPLGIPATSRYSKSWIRLTLWRRLCVRQLEDVYHY